MPDTLCDYCKYFTDAATITGNVRSSYRPGIRYAPDENAAFLPPLEKEEAVLKLVEKPPGAGPK